MPRDVHPCEKKQDSESRVILYPYRISRFAAVVYRVDPAKFPDGFLLSVMLRWIGISQHMQTPQQSPQASKTPTGRCGAYSLEGFVAIRPSLRERSVFWPYIPIRFGLVSAT